MQKKYIILSIIFIVVILVAGYVFLKYLPKEKPLVSINGNLNENINQEPLLTEKEKEIKATIGNQEVYRQKISDQNIDRDLHDQLMLFLSFCSIKETGTNLNTACRDKLFYYWGEYGIFEPCFKETWHSALIYFYKTNNKDGFLNLCKDSVSIWEKDMYEKYKVTAELCDQAWVDKVWEKPNICAPMIKHGWPILATEAGGQCANEMAIDSDNATIDLLKYDVRSLFYLIKSQTEADCINIEDPLSRLICHSIYNNNICQELDNKVNTLELPDFIKKYDLKPPLG